MDELKENRSLFKTILLSIITLGIYECVLISKIAKELNIVAEADEEHTRGFWGYMLLSLITFGIYSIVWNYKVADRMDNAAEHYDVESKVNGGRYIVFYFLLSTTLILPIIYGVWFFKTWNSINSAYNEMNAEIIDSLSIKKKNAKCEEIKDEIIDA